MTAQRNHSGLPKGWAWAKIGEISILISGQHIRSSDYGDTPGGMPYLTGPADFQEKYPIISKWTGAPKAIAQDGDVLITVKGAGVGKTNILNVREAAISRQLMAIRGINVLPNFIYYFVKLSFAHFQRIGTGSTVPGIDRESILSFPIPLPPPSEQRRIVELLDQADALRRKRLEAAALAERVLPALFYQMFGDPATNPMGWVKTTLANAGAKIRYGLGTPPERQNGGIPFIRATNITRGTISKQDMMLVDAQSVPKSRNAFLEAHDVIVVRSGAYTGDVAQVTEKWEGSVVGYDLVVSPGKELIGEYVEATLLTPFVQENYFGKHKTRAGQPHLNAKQLKETPILKPPMGLQEAFSDRIQRLRELRTQANRISWGLEILFTTMLHRAFSGELTASWRAGRMEELLQEMEVQTRHLNLQPT